MVRGPVVAVAVAAVLAACGGGSDEKPSGLTADERASVLRVQDAAEAIAIDLDDGFAAVVYALDSGYSSGLVIDAGLEGRLSFMGEVTGSDGSVVAPDGEAFDLVVPIDPAAGLLRVTANAASTGAHTPPLPPVDLETLRDFAKPLTLLTELKPTGDEITDTKLDGFRLILLVLLLSDSGYEFDQIVEFIVLGSISTEPSPESEGDPCIAFLDAAGGAVTPSGQAGDRAAALGCPRPGAEPDLPIEEEAEGTLHIDYSITATDPEDGASVELVANGTFVVADDGTVTGTAEGTVQSRGECSVEGFEGLHPYAFVADVDVAVTGTKASAYNLALAIQSGAEPQRLEGDDSLCVTVAYDLLRGIIDPETSALDQSVTIPLELGRFELPTTILFGEAPATLVILVEDRSSE